MAEMVNEIETTTMQLGVNNEDIIRIGTNIKTIAWVYIIVFAGIGYFGLHTLVGTMIQMEFPVFKEWEAADKQSFTAAKTIAIDVLFYSALMVSVSVVVILTAANLLKYRKWAANIIHVLSAVFVLLILLGIGVMVYGFQSNDMQYTIQHFGSETARYEELIGKYKVVSIGTFGLILSWTIVRSNLLLLRDEYKSLLRK